MKPFIPKEDDRLPDYYGIKVIPITGKPINYKVASHKFLYELRAIEILTYESRYILIPLDNISLEFDEEFTKLVDIKMELDRKKKEQEEKKELKVV